MKSVPGSEDIIRSAGYTVISSFRIPDTAWWDHDYTPLSKKVTGLKERYKDKDEAQTIIRGLEKEMVIHRKYSKEYGYMFFVLKNRNL